MYDEFRFRAQCRQYQNLESTGAEAGPESKNDGWHTAMAGDLVHREKKKDRGSSYSKQLV